MTRSNARKCGKSFLEIINPKDIIVESKEPYKELIECFDNKECRDKNLRIESIPLTFIKKIGEYCFKDSPNIIRLINKNENIYASEGKHRIVLAQQRKLDKILAFVEYQCEEY